jgi:predicted CoA-binding protein
MPIFDQMNIKLHFMKKTVVIGASNDKERYAYKATVSLQNHKHEVIPVGINPGEINGIKINTDKINIPDVDTVTMYVGPKNQHFWYDYVIGLKPKRVIFNPGAENKEFENLLEQNKIEVMEACTLVLLSTGQF